MKDKIFLSAPHMGGNEMNYVQEAFDTNWVSPLGPHVEKFEKELASRIKIGNVSALSSGTAAIHLALIVLGIKQGDEVICSSFTFSASANPIVYQGALPVFIDSEPDTWNMDPGLLEKAINDGISRNKKPKAIIAVHLYGMPAKIDTIRAISDRYEIPLIEDAAEALGSTWNGKSCGTFGDIGIFSFNGNKIITAAGGGALVSENPEFTGKARFLSTQARDKAPHYQHSSIGYNYRMSNILAGIGRGQLEVLDDRVSRRRSHNSYYRELLRNFDFIHFQEEPSGCFSNYWLTTILIKPNSKGLTREHVRLALESENIECRPLWKPLHLQPVFQGSPAYVNQLSEQCFDEGLCLPSGSSLTSEEIERISDCLLKVLG